METEKSEGKKKVLKWAIALAVVAVLAVAAYGCGVFYFQDRFLPGTRIGQTDVSNKTVGEMEEELSSYALQVTQRKSDGSTLQEEIPGSEISLAYEDSQTLRALLDSQNNWLWFWPQAADYETEQLLTYDEDVLNEKVRGLKGFEKDFYEKPEDAYIADYTEENGFRIVPEVMGNQLDFSKTLLAVRSAVEGLQAAVDLDAEGCYAKPEVFSDDEELLRTLKELRQYAGVKITYKFGSTTEILDGETISSWLSVDGGEVELDSEKVKEFVNSLKTSHDTIYSVRNFMTSYGKEVTIRGGDYGWWMNTDAEAEELEEMIRNGESGERTPVYYQTAESYGTPDYGNTYVEINLTAQHLFLYVNGELKVESDFVSGNPSRGNATPTGFFAVTYKERNATLRGENYATPVNWWMPFNGNVGMHDASWRASFGGDIYMTNGSHGCINLPPAVAEKIYGLISKGTAVAVYELPGTEPVPAAPEIADPNAVEPTVEPTVEPEAAAPEEAVPAQ